MRINVGPQVHCMTHDVEHYTNTWSSYVDVIPDFVAATIASWYQSPWSHGLVFAQLASTGTCDSDELHSACDYEIRIATTETDRMRLRALKAWADAHERRERDARELSQRRNRASSQQTEYLRTGRTTAPSRFTPHWDAVVAPTTVMSELDARVVL